ncbi:MAG: hypothetical protein QXF35_02880 [Candidatus Bilamarchaeaceae archaeon]
MEDEKKEEIALPPLKKILSYLALFCSFLSLFLVFVFGIVGWFAIDKVEKSFRDFTDNGCNAFKSAAEGLNDLSKSLSSNPLITASSDFAKFDKDITDLKSYLIKESDILCGNELQGQFGNIRFGFILLVLAGLFTSLAFVLNSLTNVIN